MGNPPTGQGPSPQADPVEGDVRFDDHGRLEIFDGTIWGPLEWMGDMTVPPVFRGIPPMSPSGHELAAEEETSSDNPESS